MQTFVQYRRCDGNDEVAVYGVAWLLVSDFSCIGGLVLTESGPQAS
jgi:hypothetical protein